MEFHRHRPRVTYCEQESSGATVEENRKQEDIYNKTLEKGKTKKQTVEDQEETVFATGGLRGPVINSPATFRNTFREE